jgi:hypothetical protein
LKKKHHDVFDEVGEYNIYVAINSSEFDVEAIESPVSTDSEVDNIRLDIIVQEDSELSSKFGEPKIRCKIALSKENTLEGVSLKRDLRNLDENHADFTIVNNSEKQLFGELRPGYFWGRLSSLTHILVGLTLQLTLLI